MGVTIHYEGKLRDRTYLSSCVSAAKAFAAERGWRVDVIEREEARLDRYFNEEKFQYLGPTRGIALFAHEDCDPIQIEFDKNLFLQDFTKTQFAGADVHIQVVELFRTIEPCFSELEVFDEGEYWETSDRAALEQHLNWFESALAEKLKEVPHAQVKVRLPSGKIVDLIIDHSKDQPREKKAWWKRLRRDA